MRRNCSSVSLRPPGKARAGPSVVHIASGDLWAGAEVQTFNLLRALSIRTNIRCAAVLLNEGTLADRLRSIDIPVLVLDERAHSFAGLLYSTVRFLYNFRPDIVHTHRTKENFLGAVAALMTVGTSSIRTVHGGPESALAGPLPSRSLLISIADRYIVFPLQQYAVAVSPQLGTELKVTLPPDKVTVIRNGVDTASVRRAASGDCVFDNQGRLGVCFAGRLVPVKRIDVFLEAASILARTAPGRYRFYVVGDGPLRSALQDKAAAMNLLADCQFTGFLEDPIPLLSRMSTLVIPSDHEGTPMVALECLALGVPIVAHAVGGLVPLISRAQQGQLLPTQSPELFAHAIAAVTTSRQIRPGELATNLLPADYCIDYCADEYAKLYARVARQTRQDAPKS